MARQFFTLRVDPETSQKLEQLARAQERTQAAAVRYLIKQAADRLDSAKKASNQPRQPEEKDDDD